MCGIVGVAGPYPRRPASDGLCSDVGVMLSALAHRGPDGIGIRDLGQAVIGHRRLAVIDLSERAAQPMPLACGRDGDGGESRAWIAFNGEIYNYLALRRDLSARGHTFLSDGDTEVILHLYEEQGTGCLSSLRGMFAFALWDAAARSLILARDRMGQKPLYYRLTEGGIAFASELKALVALSRARGERVEADAGSLRAYLALKYVPGPDTAVSGVWKLPAAHVLVYRDGRADTRPYWELPRAAEDEGDPEALKEELARRIRESVALRMRSDVPLGLFLSGGLDSGIIASAMSRASSRGPVATFTVGFAESDYDEMAAASRVARSLGADHHEIVIRPDARATAEELPGLAWRMDQPFADSSALAVERLSREVRRHVTVALSGDGGDELFLGYDRYRAHRLADLASRIPGATGPIAGALIRALPSVPGRRNLSGRARRFVGAAGLGALPRNDAWIGCLDPTLADSVLDPGFLAASAGPGSDPLAALHGAYASAAASDPLIAIQRADLLVYLPDDILHKVDAASMAHALEVRSPFMDHLVVELAMRIPVSMKLKGRRGKRILREIFASDLPLSILDAPKAGFGLPLDHWIRGELAGYCRDLLLDSGAATRAIARREGVRSLLENHLAGRENHEEAIWSLVMLEHWMKVILGSSASRAARVPAASARS